LNPFRPFLPVLGAAGIALLLTACGGDDDEASTNTVPTGPAAASTGSSSGAWQGEFETGTDVSLELWVDPASDPVLQRFEAFREATGANPVLYGRATATNDGDAQDTSRFAVLTDAEGDTLSETRIEVGFLCSHISRWIAAVSTLTTELNDQYTRLLNEDCDGNTLAGPVIEPDQTVTYYLAYEGESEPEFERIFMGLGNELER
jgi:hypothetical protein